MAQFGNIFVGIFDRPLVYEIWNWKWAFFFASRVLLSEMIDWDFLELNIEWVLDCWFARFCFFPKIRLETWYQRDENLECARLAELVLSIKASFRNVSFGWAPRPLRESFGWPPSEPTCANLDNFTVPSLWEYERSSESESQTLPSE